MRLLAPSYFDLPPEAQPLDEGDPAELADCVAATAVLASVAAE